MDILHFLIELQKALKAHHKEEYQDYISQLVVIMDNASVHRTKVIGDFFRKTKIVCITLPQYTPEFNPIEKYFRMVKYSITRANLFKQ